MLNIAEHWSVIAININSPQNEILSIIAVKCAVNKCLKSGVDFQIVFPRCNVCYVSQASNQPVLAHFDKCIQGVPTISHVEKLTSTSHSANCLFDQWLV